MRSSVFALVLFSTAALAEPMIGSAVGNADTLVSEGTRLFNRKQYKKAADSLLKATRADPANTATYLQLARARSLAKDLAPACYAYRVYLKAVQDSPDRKKASAESDQCERRLKARRHPPPDLVPGYVEGRASFYAALDKGDLLGTEGAGEVLRKLIADGYLGPDLGEMAQKLGAAATSVADAVYQRALSNEKVPTEALRSGRPLYQIATDVSAGNDATRARAAFLDGIAWMQEKDWKKAEAQFTDATRADGSNTEYLFYRALALFQSGDRPGALKTLEAKLPDDPRTAVLRTAVALGQSPGQGATELENMLFKKRFATTE